MIGDRNIGGYFFIKEKYGIDLVHTIDFLNKLNKKVDKDTRYEDKCNKKDFADTKNIINFSINDLIVEIDGKYTMNE